MCLFYYANCHYYMYTRNANLHSRARSNSSLLALRDDSQINRLSKRELARRLLLGRRGRLTKLLQPLLNQTVLSLTFLSVDVHSHCLDSNLGNFDLVTDCGTDSTSLTLSTGTLSKMTLLKLTSPTTMI